MKGFKKILCIVLSCIILSTVILPISSSAISDTVSWDEYLEDGKGIYIAPGADDTQMNVTWYGGAEGVAPYVLISDSEDMSNPKSFKGTIHSAPNVDRSNHVTVTGLTPGSRYYYVCCDGTTDSDVYSFRTVGKGDDFTAIYVSDIHITGENYDTPELYDSTVKYNTALTDAMTREDNIDLILSGGDQATDGRACEYYCMFAPLQMKTVPFAMAIGNHDVKRYTYDTVANYPNTAERFLSNSLVDGDYYFVKGNALFIVLDSTNSSAADHFAFTKKAVKENPDAKWRVMMFHHDIYGGHIDSRDFETTLLRMIFTPIIDTFEIDLVLTGHSHCYSQSHILYNFGVAQQTRDLDSITDPKGTMYLNNGTLRIYPDEPEKVTIFDSDRRTEFIDTDLITNENATYNTLTFTEDSLTIKSYIVGDEEAFNEFTINKTSQQGGHPETREPIWYKILKYVGTIYNVINNISRRIEISERGL